MSCMHLEYFIYQHFRMNNIDDLIRQRLILPVQVEVLLGCQPECCVGMCPIGKWWFLTRYAHRISSPLGYALSILFVFTSLLPAHILKKTWTSSSAGASFQRRSFPHWRRTP